MTYIEAEGLQSVFHHLCQLAAGPRTGSTVETAWCGGGSAPLLNVRLAPVLTDYILVGNNDHIIRKNSVESSPAAKILKSKFC